MVEKDLNRAYEEMTSIQKTALLIIALGQKWATEIMRVLKPEEVKKISFYINQMSYVPQEITERVIKEFYEKLVQKTSLASTGGRGYLMDVLSVMMGESKANDLIDNLSVKEDNDVFRILKQVDPKLLASYLKLEQSQTVALLLSYLDPERASAIIRELPDDRQIDVVTRLANLEESDPEVISSIERTLTQNLGAMASGQKKAKIGGAKAVAEIMNSIDKDSEQNIMDGISDMDADLANAIKDLMFVFADVVLLDDKSIQTVMKEVDNADLIMALKGANDAVKDKIFGNISKRQVDTIQDELSFLGPVKASVVRDAQQKIVNIIRKLDQEGEILIQGKGGGDEIIS